MKCDVETVAEAFLALMKHRGVDFLYANAGTDFASLVEAYSRQVKSKLDFPQPVICPHENLAVGMAHGYALVTGRPQAVMVHVSVGTANAVCGIMNAARDNIPMLFAAGRTPLFENGRRGARNAHIHWAQEMYDQGGLLRELVKWDYELRDGLNVQSVIDRALALSQAPPQGPVYLTLPREVMAQELAGLEIDTRALAVPSEPAPDPAAIEQLAQLIASARFPLIVTSAAGRNPQNVQLLSDFASRFGVGVVEHRSRFMSFPASHPLHLGYESHAVLARADLILVLDADVPWIPEQGEPAPEAKVVHAGVDPLLVDYPLRTFKCDLAITSSVGNTLRSLSAALAQRGAFDRRVREIEELSGARRRAQHAKLQALTRAPRITKSWMSYCLGQALPRDAIVASEYWLDRDWMDFESPGSFFSTPPAGGLGWGLPAALGVSQASPGRLVVSAVGDGAYLFANPAACHQVAASLELPVLTVICNNRNWNAVQMSALSVYPSGHASRHPAPMPLSDLGPAADFERYAEASGGYGEKVTEASELPHALRRAIDVVRNEGRQALLNVICE